MSELGNPETAKVSSQGKAKRLTLQERLAMAAKTKKKLEIDNKSNECALKSMASSVASTPSDSRPESISQDSLYGQKTPFVDEPPLSNTSPRTSADPPIGKTEKISEKLTKQANETSRNMIDADGETRNGPVETLEKESTTSANDQISNESSSISNPNTSETKEIQGGHDSAAERIPKTPLSGEEDEHGPEISILKSENEKLRTQARDLVETIDKMEQELAQAKKPMALSSLEKKLKEKDDMIAQLITEGTELSGKELKLNERIRALVAQNTKLEGSLKNYAEKNEKSLLKIEEIEDAIKLHKYLSIEQLLDGLAKSSQKITDLQNIVDRERKCNWEGKYKELQKLHDASVNEQRSVRKEISEKTVKLELLENLTRLELQSKDEIISRLNHDIISAKDEASVELSRLESKIEQLRLENESFLKTSHQENNSGQSTNSKQIEYQDYIKLLQTNHNLQEQFLSAQETWRVIEMELKLRIETLNSSVEALKRAKNKASSELKKVYGQVNSQSEELSVLRSEISRLTELETDLSFKLKLKSSECSELEEQIEKLHTAIEAEKNTHELKIQTLLETITALQNHPPEFLASVLSENIHLQNRKLSVEHFQNVRMEPRPPPRLQSLNSLNFPLYPNLTFNTPLAGWDELFTPNGQESAINYVNSDIYPQDAADSESSGAPVRSTLGATKNIQIISKMSSNIRRLEMDLVTLKEENEELVREKEQAQQEIIGLFDLKKTTEELEARANQLSQELQEKNKNEETLLQVIGEKSERVEELQADVADLKDLMRQQVQQMIEMREA